MACFHPLAAAAVVADVVAALALAYSSLRLKGDADGGVLKPS
jgi:hypothetical protein